MYIIFKQVSFNTDNLVSISIENTKHNTIQVVLNTLSGAHNLYEHSNSEEYYIPLIIKAIYDELISYALSSNYKSLNLSEYETDKKFNTYIKMYEKIAYGTVDAVALSAERDNLAEKVKTITDENELREIIRQLTKVSKEIEKTETEAYNSVVYNLVSDIKEGEF